MEANLISMRYSVLGLPSSHAHAVPGATGCSACQSRGSGPESSKSAVSKISRSCFHGPISHYLHCVASVRDECTMQCASCSPRLPIPPKFSTNAVLSSPGSILAQPPQHFHGNGMAAGCDQTSRALSLTIIVRMSQISLMAPPGSL